MSSNPFDDQDGRFLVLVNHEEQYSLWPKSNAIPNGWKQCKEGTKAECSAYVKEVWTDMRPLSLRKHMEQFEQQRKQQQQQEQQTS